MSLSCRRSLVQLARKYDALIITDDVYDFLHWPTSSPSAQHLTRAILPRLVDIDRTLEPVPGKEDFGNAVSNGTFSKIAGPGVRTGWAEATPRLIYGLSQCGSSRSGGAPSQLTATIINSLLQSGDLEEHIEKVLKPAFTRRYNLMMSAITRDLTPLGVKVEEGKVEGKDIFGGYFIWLELPEKVNAEIVSERCRERENLVVAPGDLFEVHGDESIKFQNSLRLCFAWEEEGDLEEGVKRLARVVKDVMEGKGGEIGGGRMKASKQDLGEFR
jgi:DNA-binding transcriptional MocR family regulator